MHANLNRSMVHTNCSKASWNTADCSLIGTASKQQGCSGWSELATRVAAPWSSWDQQCASCCRGTVA